MSTVKDIIDRAKAIAHAAQQAQAPSNSGRQSAKVATPATRAPAKEVSVPGKKVATSSYAPAKSSSSNYSGGSSGRSSGGGSSSGGSSSGGGGDFSGGGGDFSGGFGAAEPPPPQEVVIPDPLQQESYKRGKAEMLRARGDFDAQQALARSQYDATFDDSQRQLGWRNAVPRTGIAKLQLGEGNDGPGFDPNAQGTSYGDSYQANAGDFAGRGLFNSGLYAQAVSNVNNQFSDRRNTALRDQKDWRDTQQLNQKNFYGQQDAADLAAQEDAIGQIMAQLGVGRDQITPGRQNVISR